MSEMLKVSEIFYSIQGEGTRAGLPCAFVRLAGCNLQCDWCDSVFAWRDGEELTVDDVIARLAEFPCRRVEVTGGEPLLQSATVELLGRLCDGGYHVMLETNGSLDISSIDSRVVRIMDFKCPSSGQADKNLYDNIAHLRHSDEVKFVIVDRGDYEFAVQTVESKRLLEKCAVIFSPVHGRLPPDTLAGWMLADGLDVRLGLQIHKIIWPGVDRGV